MKKLEAGVLTYAGVYGLVCRYCARLARHEQVDAD